MNGIDLLLWMLVNLSAAAGIGSACYWELEGVP